MKSFARMTKLTNIGGRAAYITDEHRQEAILAKSEPVDWKPYQDFERANQRSATANNEGREMIIALPNEWSKLPQRELEARASVLAQTAVGKSTDLQWAVHWNHGRTNLHLHVVFSERQREKSTGKWDRNIYATADGKVARSRADRAKDSEGNFILLHRKGEEKGGFTAKDKAYSSKGWLADTKERLKQTFAERWGVNIEKQDFLHQYHEGKGKEAPAIRQKNEVIRAVNRRLDEFASVGGHVKDLFLPQIRKNTKGDSFVIPSFREDGRFEISRIKSAKSALAFLQHTEASWSANIDSFRHPEPPQRTEQPKSSPEPPKQPQKAPQSVSEPFRGQRSANPPEAQKKPSGAVLEAVKGMERAIAEYQTANQSHNECKFWQRGKKKDLSQRMDESRAEFESHVQTLKTHGVAVSFSFADAWYKPELVDGLKKVLEQPEPPQRTEQPRSEQEKRASLDGWLRDIRQEASKFDKSRQNSTEERPRTKGMER